MLLIKALGLRTTRGELVNYSQQERSLISNMGKPAGYLGGGWVEM